MFGYMWQHEIIGRERFILRASEKILKYSMKLSGKSTSACTLCSILSKTEKANQTCTPRLILKPARQRLERARPRTLRRAELDHLALDAGDRRARVEVLRARDRAVHDRVAAVELELVVQRGEALLRVLIARVGDPAVGLHEHGRSEVLVAVPPVRRARRRAAKAENALVEAVQLLAVVHGLQRLLAGEIVVLALQPRLDRVVVRVDLREIGHEVLDHLEVRQRVDDHLRGRVGNALQARERVGAVDVHRCGRHRGATADSTQGEMTEK